MKKKQLWILAGGNGAGKSTFYHHYLEPQGIPFINADILAKQIFPHAPELHSYDAAIVATQMRNQLLLAEQTFFLKQFFHTHQKLILSHVQKHWAMKLFLFLFIFKASH